MCILTFLLRKPKAIISILNLLKLGEKNHSQYSVVIIFIPKITRKTTMKSLNA